MSTSYDPYICSILKRRINQAYMMCCEGIRYMPTIQAKNFNAKLAVKINSLMEVVRMDEIPFKIINYSEQNKTDKPETRSFQTQTIEAAPEVRIVKFHSPSIQLHTPRSRNQSDRGDELLQQTIQKYEGVIESLYSQIEELQSDYEIRLATSQKQCEKMHQSHKNIRDSRGKCDCPVQELRDEVKRLEGELRKRDKAKLKKIHKEKDHN